MVVEAYYLPAHYADTVESEALRIEEQGILNRSLKWAMVFEKA